VSFDAVILCVDSQRVFVVVVFVIHSVQKLLDTPSYNRIEIVTLPVTLYSVCHVWSFV